MMAKKIPLRWKMTMAIMIFWILPIIVAIVIIVMVLSANINEQIEKTIEISAKNAIGLCNLHIDEVIDDSRKASYLGNLKVLKGNNVDGYETYKQTTNFLNTEYRYNKKCLATFLYYTDDPEEIFYTSRDSRHSSEVLTTGVLDEVRKIAEDIGTNIKFAYLNGHLFLIRNMVDANNKFEVFATLIMDLDTESIFESVSEIWNYGECNIYINQEFVMGNPSLVYAEEFFKDSSDKFQHIQIEDTRYVTMTEFVEGERIDYMIELEQEVFLSANSTVNSIFLGSLVLLLPVVFIVYFFFRSYITKPVDSLVTAVQKLEREKYGYQIEEEYKEEFGYLKDCFNSMSLKLKKQFETIYLEELALKDAKINALQSQINPHFLNNTLEIINWEARMVENYRVSEMIESLSIMLEATINRSGEKIVTLAEELNYVEAYLNIIKKRFGKKLIITQDIDNNLLKYKVPKLIIQPIIENAVDYGMNRKGIAKIFIHIFEEDQYIYIDVHDNGTLTEENEEKIRRLLSGEEGKERITATSVGIRNVNIRLQIMFGEESKLTIMNDENNTTRSRIKIKEINE